MSVFRRKKTVILKALFFSKAILNGTANITRMHFRRKIFTLTSGERILRNVTFRPKAGVSLFSVQQVPLATAR